MTDRADGARPDQFEAYLGRHPDTGETYIMLTFLADDGQPFVITSPDGGTSTYVAVPMPGVEVLVGVLRTAEDEAVRRDLERGLGEIEDELGGDA
jgi:hypothetical protein